MSSLITIWGLRLTYNFHRRGGYHIKFWQGEEDYRWSILRKEWPLNNPIFWKIFNFAFIAIYQNLLIWGFSLPIAFAKETKSIHFGDCICSGAIIALIIIETVADHQQWVFQSAKYSYINSGNIKQIFYKY